MPLLASIQNLRVVFLYPDTRWAHLPALQNFRINANGASPQIFDLGERTHAARQQFAHVSSPSYLSELRCNIGADLFTSQIPS